MMLHFEDFMLMRYQVQELMRTEKLTDKEKEILVSSMHTTLLYQMVRNLKATMMLEYPNPEERQERLQPT